MRIRQALVLAALMAAAPFALPLVPEVYAFERPILLAQAPPGEETTQPGGVESHSPETPAGEQTTDPGGTEAQLDAPDSTQLAHQPRDDSVANRDIFTPVSSDNPVSSSSFWTYAIFGVIALVILGIVLRRRAT